jgi:hypothetical protein
LKFLMDNLFEVLLSSKVLKCKSIYSLIPTVYSLLTIISIE